MPTDALTLSQRAQNKSTSEAVEALKTATGEYLDALHRSEAGNGSLDDLRRRITTLACAVFAHAGPGLDALLDTGKPKETL